MQPFTLDQAIIAGMLFLLGLLIGMFLLAGGKWKKRYAVESARVADLERENARLVGELRGLESSRPVVRPTTVATPVHREEPARGQETRVTTTTTETAAAPVAEPYRRVDTSRNAKPDIVIRRD